ncbi:hypothetical protein DLM76_03990 [Leptospira yasudae]|uniref:Uncharacterized protein n=1 Tax=Leptospira yasudae TaxID=2202201 RepID=A0A5F2BPE6_9LEPT|nr:hypothetical protein [Leptospira yasudae]MBW0432816.1 hypothetical protein [Leptospira yasudae]RHX81334.1 hypothetical protein DLM77_04325 [Leptospira yasudae]RHX96124.1 hypothetical protein DLM76_03990 [Leptospira yasudae]TGK29941.1 hypothetical protein EHQ05_02985 [Leptospira yasudae]TGL77193.1 hypothetical protein EHQ77_17360 [Leptospira yasudae]
MHLERKHHCHRRGHFVGKLLFIPIIVFGIGALVWQLWNWLMPAIFGLTTIDYWQACGLLVLSHLLIKPGFGWHRGGYGGRGRRWRHRVRRRLDAREKKEE